MAKIRSECDADLTDLIVQRPYSPGKALLFLSFFFSLIFLYLRINSDCIIVLNP